MKYNIKEDLMALKAMIGESDPLLYEYAEWTLTELEKSKFICTFDEFSPSPAGLKEMLSCCVLAESFIKHYDLKPLHIDLIVKGHDISMLILDGEVALKAVRYHDSSAQETLKWLKGYLSNEFDIDHISEKLSELNSYVINRDNSENSLTILIEKDDETFCEIIKCELKQGMPYSVKYKSGNVQYYPGIVNAVIAIQHEYGNHLKRNSFLENLHKEMDLGMDCKLYSKSIEYEVNNVTSVCISLSGDAKHYAISIHTYDEDEDMWEVAYRTPMRPIIGESIGRIKDFVRIFSRIINQK